MEPTYSIWADALSKFHTTSDPIQALCIVACAATLLGMTWCVTRLIRDIVLAVTGQGGTAYAIEQDERGRWIVRRCDEEERATTWRRLPATLSYRETLTRHETPIRHGRA